MLPAVSANRHPEDLMHVAPLLEKALGRTAAKGVLPMQRGDATETFADIADLMRDTGLKSGTSIEDGITNFVASYGDHYRI
jgi:UDP-glucuronate 4-epimerase